VTPKVAIAAGCGLLLLVVILQNTEEVGVRFLFWELRMSRLLLILVGVLAGFVGGYAAAAVRRRADRPSPPGATD
jgi:uncharacterized integral membrane protein